MQVLKYYSIDYLSRISKTTDRVHSNMDAWIIVSVKLQNKALNNVREQLNQYIENIELIPEDYFNKYHIIANNMVCIASIMQLHNKKSVEAHFAPTD